MNDVESICIEGIPNDIQQLIVEKFSYEDYARFYECSKLSSEICSVIPSFFRFSLCVEEMFFIEDGEFARFKGQQLVLSRFPKKVRIHCTHLRIHVVDNLQSIDKFRITTEFLYFYGRGTAAAVVAKLISATKPSRFHCLPSRKDITCLEEVRQVQDLCLTSDFETDDETLINLRCPRIQILGNLKITVDGIARFFEQWCKKEREIEDIRLSVYDYNTLTELKNRLSINCVTETRESSAEERTLFICRSERHDDCIKLKQEWYMTTLSKVADARCPNFKEI